MGQSGWLIALPWVVSIVGIFVAIGMIGVAALGNVAALEREDPAAILALITPVLGLFGLLTLVNLGFLLWIFISPVAIYIFQMNLNKVWRAQAAGGSSAIGSAPEAPAGAPAVEAPAAETSAD